MRRARRDGRSRGTVDTAVRYELGPQGWDDEDASVFVRSSARRRSWAASPAWSSGSSQIATTIVAEGTTKIRKAYRGVHDR